MYLNKISIICTLWYEVLNDLDAQNDFHKIFVSKKLVKYHSYLKNAFILFKNALFDRRFMC